MPKTISVSITQAIALFSILIPDLRIPVQLMQLVDHVMNGRWNDVNAKLGWISTLYGNAKAKMVMGFLIGIGGALAKRYLKISKVASLGPLTLRV